MERPDSLANRRLSRRSLLRSAVLSGSGLLAAQALGCDGSDDPPPLPTSAPTSTAEPTLAATPAAEGWRQIAPAGPAPPARAGHSLSTDGRRLFVFGGSNANGALDDVWMFDFELNAWTAIDAGPGPGPRAGHVAGWDQISDALIVHGGRGGGPPFGDVWSFDPAAGSWRELPSLGGPAPRFGAGGTVDSIGRLLVTHGRGAAGLLSDSWAYVVGEERWLQLMGGTPPAARDLTRAVWDPATVNVILFGGEGADDPFLGDLWGLGVRGWAEQETDVSPPPRKLHAMTFAADRGRMLLFGGSGPDGLRNDLWILRSAATTWTKRVEEVNAPSPRSGHDAVWLPARGSLVVFGGSDASGELDELWELGIV